MAVAQRRAPADAKGSINLRIGTQTRRLIDDAAAVLGKTRTEFMIESARDVAKPEVAGAMLRDGMIADSMTSEGLGPVEEAASKK